MKNFSSRYLLWFLLILVAAGILRFYGLGRADVITDEALVGFRSIGYIDFFVSPYQTTPYEWFSDIPTWARLSFHDHPPLVFLIQHFFFKLFGQNIIALRLPFALAGLLSIYLIYLIGKKLFGEKIGLLAAILLSVCQYHIWISRIGLQESLVILFSLLTFYFFLKSLEDGCYWKWGICFGLAMLTKYTSVIIFPILIIYLLIFRRKTFSDKRFWLSLLLIILIFSPVLVYNLKLYQARGHFDLQLSYLLGQKVSEWQFLPGKILAGSFSDRLKNLIPNLYQGMLWPMFITFIASFIYGLHVLCKQKDKAILLLILAIFCHLILFLATGPEKRFISVIIPFTILLISWFIYHQRKTFRYLLIIILVGLELFFTVNTLLAYYPWGQEGITYSNLKIESYGWGYNQLNTYLVQLLKDKKPAVTFTTRYKFLEDIKNQALAKAERKGLESAPILLIYDNNMYDLATLWLFHRRMVYDGWPIITSDIYLEEGLDFWHQQGVQDFYFFKIIDSEMLQRSEEEKTADALILANKLSEQKIKPEIIKRPDGREVFKVYYWQ